MAVVCRRGVLFCLPLEMFAAYVSRRPAFALTTSSHSSQQQTVPPPPPTPNRPPSPHQSHITPPLTPPPGRKPTLPRPVMYPYGRELLPLFVRPYQTHS